MNGRYCNLLNKYAIGDFDCMGNNNVRIDSSKIRIPDIAGTVLRPRLLKRLGKSRQKNLIFLTGQAAQGKSTLAASYLRDSAMPCAWINVSVEDSDPVNLFYTLLVSLEKAVENIDLAPLRDYPALSAGPRDDTGLYRDWLDALFGHLSFPLHIVFDGLDRLEPAAPSFLFFKVCSEIVPPTVQLWFLSRTVEPFNLEELKMNPKGFVMENSELSFTKTEIKQYFEKYNRIRLDQDHLARVHRLTEGWVGGLILVSEVLDCIPEDKQDNNLSSDVSSAFRLQAFKYFGEIIFKSLPRRTQRFLIVSSIFETLHPKLLSDLYAGGDCMEILADLVRRNLFIHSIYDEKEGWLFRYHQLFRDYLATRFHSDMGEDERAAVLHQAASLCEAHGKRELAVHFYIRCGRYQKAVKGIETIGMDLLKTGRTADLANLVQTLPEHHVRDNPWLLLYLSATRRYTGAEENAHSLKAALTLFKQTADVQGQLVTLALLIEASTYRGRDIIPIGLLIEEAEALLNAISFEEYQWESAILWHQIGFGLALRAGDQRKGYQACQNAYLISKAINNRPLQIAALAGGLLPLAVMGEFGLVKKTATNTAILLKQHPYPELRALYLLNYSQASTVEGELSRAHECAAEAKEIAEAHGLLYLYPVALLSELMLNPQMGNFPESEASGRQLLEFAEAFGIQFLSSVAFMFLGLSHYLKQDYSAAGKCYTKSCRIASSDDGYSETHISWNLILLGLIHFYRNNYPRAEALLNEALGHFSEINSSLTIVVVNWALAFVKNAQKDHERSIKHLIAGIDIAEKNGFYHFFFMNKEDYYKVGLLCMEYNLSECEAYVAKLFALRLAEDAIHRIRRYIGQSKGKSKSMASRILGYVYRFNVPKIRVETLNGFRAYREDHLMKDDEWGGILPQSLLKAIITRGGRQVPKERIMEDLWPEAPKSATEANFKVNLHRLRMLLEPSMMKKLGSSYIRLKDNLISLDEELVLIDLDKFNGMIHKANTARSEGDTKSAIRCLNEAVAIYQSDFLADDIYNEAISHKREILRQQYVEAMFQLVALYETKGALKKAEAMYKKIIASDPFSEAAHQKLMLNYANRGKTSKAIQMYLEYEHALRVELDTYPDDVTRSIYQKLRDEN